ncbi:hypothetical protein [Pseudomonas pergaminensis]|uniref:hypothetical protein n=1 Tax=Pseudomonas pergaminensis TaxID=2853159 RepID=UPI0034D61CE3
MKRVHGPAFRRELKFIVECSVCRGTGIYTGVFHQMTCENCHASGWVCGRTLTTLPLMDVVQVLNVRLKEVQQQLAVAQRALAVMGVDAGPARQYNENNRRGPGATNFTGD